MARKYSKSASKDVERAMHKEKRGTLKSGRRGKIVKSRKQAIAIGLSEARKKGKKVPKKKAELAVVRHRCSHRLGADHLVVGDDALPRADGGERGEILPLLEKLHGGEIAAMAHARRRRQGVGEEVHRHRHVDTAQGHQSCLALLERHRFLVVVDLALVGRLERRLGAMARLDDELHVNGLVLWFAHPARPRRVALGVPGAG